MTSRPPPDDPLAPPTPEEERAAEALRSAFEAKQSDDDVAFLDSLKAAHAPRDLDAATHRALIDAAIAKHDAKRTANDSTRRGVVVRVFFGASAMVAAAAAVVLFVQARGFGPGGASGEPFFARSTASLFDEPFALRDGATGRIDRIAAARASDFRENRFAHWGVR